MPMPRRVLDAADLLPGDDHEFVVNLYLGVLRRWPDEAGYRHFMRKIANRPEQRLEAVREIAGSAEAHRLGSLVEIPGPVPPAEPLRALRAMLDVRTEVMQAEIAGLREALETLTGLGGGELAKLGAELAEAREAELRSEINGLRRELGEALAAAAPAAAGGGLEARLRRIEARLDALEARLTPPPIAPGDIPPDP